METRWSIKVPDEVRRVAHAARRRLAKPLLGVMAEENERGRLANQPVEQNPGVVVVCDEPADEAAVARGSVVDGWAFSPVGIKEVTVWLDGKRVGQATHGLERPDVAEAFFERPDALYSGFRWCLDTHLAPPLPRTAEIMIVAEDNEGSRGEVRRRVELVESSLPMAGSLDIPKRLEAGDPFKMTGWSSPLVVYGWAVDPQGVDRIEVLLDDEVVAHAEHGVPREDVEMLAPDYRALGLAERSGWLAVIPTRGFSPGEHALSATVYGGSGTLPLGPTTIWLRDTSVRADSVRQQRLETILRCPKCGASLERREAGLLCGSCGHAVRSNEFGTLLFEETYADLDWRDAVGTNHAYPPEAVEVILDCQDGLVLEIGAGLRENLHNVIQLDAIAFPNTDVSANAEVLPFADESFDGVVASNLFEHVSSPAAVVREMRRVCKIGGRIYADFTTVHPYHGFPHHYFNATQTGLDWLMREIGGATGTTEPTDPRVAVRLVLQAWVESLEDAEARQVVKGLSVGEHVDLFHDPYRNPELHEALDHVFANGRRLVPPTGTSTGVRTP